MDAIEAYDNAGQPELAGELAKQIIYYGTKGQMTTDNAIIEGFVKAMCVALIDKSKKRYNACRGNGKQGGRPVTFNPEEIITMYTSGLNEQEIAKKMGCSIQTVQRALQSMDNDI